MMQDYDTKFGFIGLSAIGKIAFIFVFLSAAVAIWQFNVRDQWQQAQAQDADIITIARVCTIGIAKIIGSGLIAAYFAHFFLPKKKFYKNKFYCADCGQFLGYSIQICPNPQCRSNRYTTSPKLAPVRPE
jgi:hypothetical protein